jgi:hypothetical protein
VDLKSRQAPCFIHYGALERRNNHLTALSLRRELIARDGRAAPKPAIVGARGWENENIVYLLARRLAQRGHALEVSGLRTPSLVGLMKEPARRRCRPSPKDTGRRWSKRSRAARPSSHPSSPFSAKSPVNCSPSSRRSTAKRGCASLKRGRRTQARPAKRRGPASPVQKRYFRALKAFVVSP